MRRSQVIGMALLSGAAGIVIGVGLLLWPVSENGVTGNALGPDYTAGVWFAYAPLAETRPPGEMQAEIARLHMTSSPTAGVSQQWRSSQDCWPAAARSASALTPSGEPPRLTRAPPSSTFSPDSGPSPNTVQLGLHRCSLAVCLVLGGRSRSRIVACRTWCRSAC